MPFPLDNLFVISQPLILMRFGKRLALAMLRDAGESPYLSQKELKHILVGLEKLCKSYNEQLEMLKCKDGDEKSTVIAFANMEREKYGLEAQQCILDISEVVSRDQAFLSTLNDDIIRIRRYVEKCEADLMAGFNEWLASAALIGVLVSQEPSREILSHYVPDIKPQTELFSELDALVGELKRLKQYVEVNSAAVRKLLGRRHKNVAECFWSVYDFNKNVDNIYTPESREIHRLLDHLRTASLLTD